MLSLIFADEGDFKAPVDDVLDNPDLHGVALVFPLENFSKQNVVPFLAALLDHGKSPYVVLTLSALESGSIESSLRDFINYLKEHFSRLDDPRVAFVLALDSANLIPVSGSSNTVAAAVKMAMELR